MRKKNYVKLSDEERQAIIAAYKAGETRNHALMDRFHRSFGTIKEITDEVKAATPTDGAPGQEPLKALILSSPPSHVMKRKKGRPKKLDDLALVNQALEASMSNVLEEPLARFMEKARKLLPNAHTIVIDMVNMRAKAHIAQELDLVVGGGK